MDIAKSANMKEDLHDWHTTLKVSKSLVTNEYQLRDLIKEYDTYLTFIAKQGLLMVPDETKLFLQICEKMVVISQNREAYALQKIEKRLNTPDITESDRTELIEMQEHFTTSYIKSLSVKERERIFNLVDGLCYVPPPIQ